MADERLLLKNLDVLLERNLLSIVDHAEMQKEVKRAVKSEPEAFVREKFLFKKEDNGGVDDMKDDIREEDVEESLHGVDMLGMSNRAGGVRNLFANAFLAEGDVVLVFADNKDPLDYPKFGLAR